MDLEYFLIMVAPYLVILLSLAILFGWAMRGNDSSLEP
ncbi:cytochrome bd oxidase small subunit CydS [Paenibacillus athensensis]